MKLATLLQILALAFVSACAHRYDYATFRERVEKSQVETLADVRRDTDDILQAHPEIDEATKVRVRELVATHLETFSALRAEENKLIHAVLEEGLNTTEAVAHRRRMRAADEELARVYRRKAANLSQLVEGITQATAHLVKRREFYDEMEHLIREIR